MLKVCPDRVLTSFSRPRWGTWSSVDAAHCRGVALAGHERLIRGQKARCRDQSPLPLEDALSVGGKQAVATDDQVMNAAEVQALRKQVRELERLLGKKTVEILKDAIEIAREKTDLVLALRGRDFQTLFLNRAEKKAPCVIIGEGDADSLAIIMPMKIVKEAYYIEEDIA